ncbi:disease resistance protein RPV1-like [Citrus sinensis]|uniref:disease resistance protein RPV1-like n=1 Tax=Citrus sinensis TaxID=2711 RepID=UPI002278CAA6|nr:disease resistance protein RPV1-like [Citrus sinensis]
MFKSLASLEIINCPKLERLPDELGNSKALEELRVEGAAIREVPESLSQLALLSTLVLKNCSELEYISSNIFKLKSSIYIEISNCSNLKSFPKIPSCNIDGSTGIERPSSSTLRSENCSSLVSLSSSMCKLKSLSSLQIIDCKKLERLPYELGNLETLKELRVEGAAIREVPESLSQLPLFSRLVLKNCSELEYISSNIFKLKSSIYIEISNCSNLKSFPKIPSCYIDGSTGIERPSSSRLRLEKCSSLVSLSSSLCMLKSLSSLQIIDCKKLERLPESLGQLALLCELKMIKCSSFESLPSSLCMLKYLTSLAIIDCKNFKRLPNELGNLKCLVVLIVKGTAIREVPESLGQLSSIVRLDLSNNNLERTPASLYQLSSIKYLKLFDNNFKHRLLTLSVDLNLVPNVLSEIINDRWRKLSFHVKVGSRVCISLGMKFQSGLGIKVPGLL